MFRKTPLFFEEYDEIVKELILPIYISSKSKNTKMYKALINTGSKQTYVSAKVVDGLSLKFISHKKELNNKYYVDFNFSTIIEDILVEEKSMEGNYDIIIGMDVLKYGNLKIDNSEGHTVVRFEKIV